MVNYLLVGCGGLVGSILRYWLSGAIAHVTKGDFPFGTLVVNVVGCFAIGFFLALGYERFAWRPEIRLFVAVGILGGFTTFSTFSYETISLFRDSSYLPALANAAASLLGCLVATFLGIALARKI